MSKLTEDEDINVKKIKESKLADYMIRYGKAHQPVTLTELQEIYTEADENDINQFHNICFLVLAKEQSQWHSAKHEKWQIGMTVAQARCLIMVKEGYISFKEVFKNAALFSVYSHTGLTGDGIEEVAESCKHIDELYTAYLQTKNSKDYLLFFKKHIKKDYKPPYILTRKQAHEDLKSVYGGDSDTDGEGYDSDLSL